MYLHTLILLCLETEVLFLSWVYLHEDGLWMKLSFLWIYVHVKLWMKSSSKARALIQSVDDDSMATVLFAFFKFWDLHHFSLSCGNIVRGFQSTCLYWRESPWMLKEKCQSSQLTWCLLTRYLHSWAVMSPSCKLNESDQVEGCRLLLTWGTIPISEAIFKPYF